MIKRLLVLLILAGCAAQQQQQQGQLGAVAEQSDRQNRARIHMELGAGYYSRGQYDVALKELNEALKADPSYAPAYNILGLVYMDLKEDSRAEQNFTQAIRLNPNDPEAHNNYGWFLCQRNREAHSIPQFLAALKNPLYSTPDRALVNAGVCSAKMGDVTNADEYFRRALAINPNQSEALYYLAELAYKRANYTEAKIQLGRNMQASTPTAAALWLGARIERKLGNREAESSYVLQLRKRFPDSQEAKTMANGQYD